MILLWGLGGDAPLAMVGAELSRLGAHWVLVDQRDVLAMAIDFAVGVDVVGMLRLPRTTVDLNTVSAVYLRPYDACQLPAIVRAGPTSAEWRHALGVDNALTAWSEVTAALVVNRLEPSATNDSKPYQLELIRAAGFAVPDTLVTTDPSAALDFWDRHGAMIYKSISSVRSIVRRFECDDVSRLAAITDCPVQFQEYVPGVDWRVHVVGDDIFACEINSQVVDYRYGGSDQVEMAACAPPPEVADRCRRLSAALGLPVAGIDLRRSEEDEWYCLEVNPSPGFSYFENQTGLPIAAAIARLLAYPDGYRQLVG